MGWGRGITPLAAATAALAAHGITSLDAAALPDLVALAAASGANRCRAVLVRIGGRSGVGDYGSVVGRGSGRTEAEAVGRALAVALGRERRA